MIKTTKLGRDGMVRVTFTLPAAEPTGAVSVVGDFNGWDPFAHPLRRRGGFAKGIRSASVTVPPGSTLRFRYLAEGGQWFDDETISAGDGRDAILAVLSVLPAGQGLAEEVLGDPGQVGPHRLHRDA
jgi:hypothetical protein